MLLGNGNGTFQTQVNYSLGGTPQSVVTGDFNLDGIVDLAIAGSNGISVLLGNGDGTFRAASVIGGLNTSFVSLAAGDINLDGKPDLIGGGYGNVYIFKGNGDGTFQTGIYQSSSGMSVGVLIADFNADGKPDLALNLSGNCGVLLGNGDGTFQTQVVYPSAGCSVAADFNGDGKVDLADTSGRVLFGAGNGTFLQPAIQYSASGNQVVAGDFNGDGRTDLAYSTYSNTVNILYGNSSLLSQTITFGPISNQILGSSLALNATASSGLAGHIHIEYDFGVHGFRCQRDAAHRRHVLHNRQPARQ